MDTFSFKNVQKNFSLYLDCPVRLSLDVIGGKWKLPIIHQLWDGTMRYKELERAISGITPKMLIKELKDLEQFGLVKREQFATIPPTVEYSLTKYGKELEPVVAALHQFGKRYIQRIHKEEKK